MTDSAIEAAARALCAAITGMNPDDIVDGEPAWCGFDLLPPRLSLEEAARECHDVYCRAKQDNQWSTEAMLAALQHYEKMKAEGRV